MRLISISFLGLLLVTLSACSGEPSSAAMKQAFEKALAAQALAQSQLASAIGGPQVAAQFQTKTPAYEFQKLGCVAAVNEPGYVCDFSVTVRASAASITGKGRFFRGSTGWEFEERA